ncbi:unnamed protein product [Anisakis simplex]|uniref:TIR domain-containing protein n=1 Tax=Anisakis simplex TaxID=6269 RepID=A0A0M3JV71_ANISI|nr:unnamed protein product [Anisakis simplex]
MVARIYIYMGCSVIYKWICGWITRKQVICVESSVIRLKHAQFPDNGESPQSDFIITVLSKSEDAGRLDMKLAKTVNDITVNLSENEVRRTMNENCAYVADGDQLNDRVENGDDQRCSLTIDIEMDSDDPQNIAQYALTQLSSQKENEERCCSSSCMKCCSFETFHDAPPTACEARPYVGDNALLVGHLPQVAHRQIELYLNPPSYGSMHNWQYLASNFGVSNNEIMARIPYLFCLRSAKNPTRVILERFARCSLNHFLDLICELNRIDVLITLQPYVNGLKASADALQASGLLNNSLSDSGAFFDEFAGQSSSMRPPLAARSKSRSSGQVPRTCYAQPELLLPLQSSAASSGSSFQKHYRYDVAHWNLSEKIILITHHEDETSDLLKKNFKWLMKNLRKYGKETNCNVLNIEECLCEGDILGGLHALFENAMHIVCVFSDDYTKMLTCSDEGGDQLCILKRYLHSLMDSEYMQHSGVNQRFRAVILEGTERDVLPTGWPQNTLVYVFPTHHVELFKKLFD